jgi:diguanylate cyclase (GGDEF)-like protein/PAS domain S-box-containing protein
MNHSGPDQHDPTTRSSSSEHATERAQGATPHPSDDWLRTVLENTSDVICVLKADGSFRYISPAVKRVLGYPPEALLGTVCFDYVHTDDAAFVAESFAQILKTPGLHTPLQFRVRTKDGSLRYVEAIPNNQLEDPTLQGMVVTFRDLTERVRMEKVLREAQERYRTLVEHLPAVVYVDTPKGPGYAGYTSPQAEAMLGYPLDAWDADPLFWTKLLHPDDKERVVAENTRANAAGEPLILEYRMISRDDRVVWLHDESVVLPDETGQIRYRQGVLLDITKRKEAEKALREAEVRYRTLVEQIPAITYIDRADGSDEPLYTSPQIEEMLGYTAEEWLEGRLWSECLHPVDKERVLAADERFESGGERFSEEYRLFAKDGSVVWVREDAVLTRDETGGPLYWQGVLFNITERKALEEQLQRQALHDTLTGLPNRALFSDRLQHAVARTQRRGGKVAVLFMDLDNFKVINDSLGHNAGDELLVGVTGRLRASLRPEDTAARLGGDEFAILLVDLNNVDEATLVAERIGDKLRAPFELAHRETFVTASIGVAISGTTGTPRWPEELLRHADLAMYRAKHSGKARYAIFEEAMSARAMERLELSNDLRRALEREEFAVHYQPQVSLATGKTMGFEALVRWEHPERGQLLPARFIPLAEETGLIVPIGQWVLREACHQAKEWNRQYPSDPSLIVCVNLSAKQLRDPNLYRVVGQILEESGLEPGSLELEITESVAMEDAPATAAALEELHTLGVRVIIDDFGTGYSSLSYLEKFPMDYIKIDRSFVGELEGETGSRVLVKVMIDLVHTLGLEVIAEGVETTGQLERLREMGSDIAQGRYFSRPLPSEAAASLLEKQHL